MNKKSVMDIAAKKRREILSQQKVEHEIGLVRVLEAVVRYECDFCHQLFSKLSECAKHIEEESITGFASPDDISIAVVDSSKALKKE